MCPIINETSAVSECAAVAVISVFLSHLSLGTLDKEKEKYGVIFIHDQLLNSTFFHPLLRLNMLGPLHCQPKSQINIKRLSC